MTIGVVWLLKIPGLMLVGGLGPGLDRLQAARAGRIAAKRPSPRQANTFWGAMKTIVIADALMGVDNVLGVAGAAKGSFDLVVLGLLISVPIVVWGSTLVLKLVERFPVITYLGAGVLAYTAAHMIVSEPLLDDVFDPNLIGRVATYAVLIVGVLAAGWWAARRVLAARRNRLPPDPATSDPPTKEYHNGKDRRVRQRRGACAATSCSRCCRPRTPDALDPRRQRADADAPHRPLGVALGPPAMAASAGAPSCSSSSSRGCANALRSKVEKMLVKRPLVEVAPGCRRAGRAAAARCPPAAAGQGRRADQCGPAGRRRRVLGLSGRRDRRAQRDAHAGGLTPGGASRRGGSPLC